MITGDFARLGELRRRLEASSEFKRRASEKVAEKIEAQLEHQYESGTDPDNEGWAELAPATLAKGRTPPPLTDTGEMRKNSKAVAGVAGVNVSIDKPSKSKVPEYHQDGTEHMPARKLVPEGSELPSAWNAAVAEGIGEAAIEHFELGGSK